METGDQLDVAVAEPLVPQHPPYGEDGMRQGDSIEANRFFGHGAGGYR